MLQGCALRYEAAAQELPDDFLEASQAVAAALLITHARWQLHASHPEQVLDQNHPSAVLISMLDVDLGA